MTRVVDNEQIVRSVEFISKCADSTVELQLCFALDVQLSDLGVVVEAVAKQSLKL